MGNGRSEIAYLGGADKEEANLFDTIHSLMKGHNDGKVSLNDYMDMWHVCGDRTFDVMWNSYLTFLQVSPKPCPEIAAWSVNSSKPKPDVFAKAKEAFHKNFSNNDDFFYASVKDAAYVADAVSFVASQPNILAGVIAGNESADIFTTIVAGAYYLTMDGKKKDSNIQVKTPQIPQKPYLKKCQVTHSKYLYEYLWLARMDALESRANAGSVIGKLKHNYALERYVSDKEKFPTLSTQKLHLKRKASEQKTKKQSTKVRKVTHSRAEIDTIKYLRDYGEWMYKNKFITQKLTSR
jgi:hypothetical protein